MKRSSTYEGSHSDGREENLVRSEINGYTYISIEAHLTIAPRRGTPDEF